MKNMDSNVVNSLSDLIDIFKVSMKSAFEEPNIRLYFRGENADFGDTTCLPSIFREKLRTPDVKNIEQDIYYRFLRRYPEEFVNMSNLDVLTKMQHFGVPTRLLDITTNPLVALFFSCYSSSDDYSRDGFFYAFKADKTNILTFDSDKALLLSTFPKVNFKVLRDIEEYIECNSHIPITPKTIEDNDEALIGVKINNDIIGTIDEKIECNKKYILALKNKSELIYGSDRSEIASINKLVSIQTGKEDANFAVPNGSYKFFTCAEQSSLCEDYKYEGKNILLAGNGTFNVNHYCGKFNAYQRTYIIKPFNEYDYGLLYFGIKSYVGNLVSSSTGSIVKFIGIDDVKNIKVKKLSPDMRLVLFSNLNRIDVLLDEIDTLSQMRKTLLPLLLNEQVAIL